MGSVCLSGRNNLLQADINILSTCGLMAMHSHDILRIGHDGSMRSGSQGFSFVADNVAFGRVNQGTVDVDFDSFIVVVAHIDWNSGDGAGIKGAPEPDVGCFPHRSQSADVRCDVGSKPTLTGVPF